ncbi:hypothetical protein [Streptomyces sp. NBC_00847]|uniref:hypothetical protein n=1 Tax=Streptomyces sp. NBC_00847 TaxID=2975850 RepID=UPI00225E686F|nr:hypothetical protein [Streptomyces sp. NBC_00847]MCX4885855.1 hypothetical protein [Streptomyces sp. NBC_00847]
MDIGKELVQLRNQITSLQRSSRLGHASIENAAVQVYDGTGSLRGIVGVQADGTTAVNIVNGTAPPQPADPVVASVLGGVTVSWDGSFADGQALPLDWARVEVHAAITPVYDPVPATLQDTIETAQGATVVVPCDTPVYVRLVARNTSGTASTPSGTIGPFGPTPVVADDILDGIVTTVKLADDAVTKAKVAVGAIGSDELAVGIGNLAPDPSFEGALTAAAIAGHADWTQVTPGNNSATALHVDCTAGGTTWKNIELARYPVLPGERHFLGIDFTTSAGFNGTGVKLMFRYEDATATVLGYGVADKAFTPGAGWDRATAQVQAPTGTKTAVLLVEASACSAGEVWFDNAEVSTLIVGGKVAAGSITATEIAALTIQAANIAADAIAAGKIAADAVTAREIAALTVTAAEIAANTIVAGNLAAGSVDATALAATAITGKTISGGTITGSLIQTAATGQRITLNEASANKIIVYNSSGTAIGELSANGLLVKGTNGAIIQLDPNNAFPNLNLTNASNTKSAVINISGTDALLGLNSGQFSSGSYTDWKWRTLFGNSSGTELWSAERTRDSDTTAYLGGRIFLDATHGTFGFQNSADATQNATIAFTAGNAALTGNLTVSGIGQRTTKRRTTDATKTSNATPGTDSSLTFTVDASATYVFDGYLKYSGPGDFQMIFTYPSGTLGEWQGLGNGTTVASATGGGGTQQDVSSSWGYTVRTESNDISIGRTYGGISTNTYGIQVRGLIRVAGTGGTFALQWAQGTSNATGTILYTDSHIRLEKVA